MKKLAIITPTLGKYSETFIKNQIDFLPFSKVVVTLEPGEFANEEGKPLASFSLFARLKRLIKRKILNLHFEDDQNILLSNYLKSNKADHVLFQYGVTAKKGYKACIKAKIPYTVHFHGYDAYINKFDKNFYKEVLSSAKNVVVVSKNMEKRLHYLGCDSNKITIIPYGSNFEIEKQNPANNKDKTKFLAVGRFVEKKAPYLTILAFAQAVKTNSSLELIMVGDGMLLSVCKDLVKALELGENVHFYGSCSHAEVQKLMQETNFFIQHSKQAENGDSEGLPNAIIEALILNKPVISTYHAGIPEIVKDGINGLLSSEGNVNSMAENILKSINLNFQFPYLEFIKLENSIKHLKEVLDGR